MDDRELLDAWSRGDDQAGRQFYRRHCDRITALLSRKTSTDVADLVQRVFLRCLDAKKRGTEIERPLGLLLTIARNELYDHLAARSRHAQFDPAVTSLRDLGPSPSQQLAADQQQQHLLLAMEQLPLDDQLALELYYWEQLPMSTVAQVLRIGRSAALSRVHRARQRLRDRLDALPLEPAAQQATLDRLGPEPPPP